MAMSKYQRSRPKGNNKPVFIDGVRTPFVKSFGVFQKADSLELFSRVVDGLVRKLDVDPMELDEISCGVVVPQTKNANVARDAIVNLGLPSHIHGYTLNRACAASLQTAADAARTIAFGDPSLIIAGGVECLSDVPIAYSKEARSFLLSLNKAKTAAARLKAISQFHAKDWVPKPPALAEPLTGLTMGESAEIMAKLNEISREDQDVFGVASHTKASAARKNGHFDDEIIPVWPSPTFDCVAEDNLIRDDASLEKMAGLKPAFDRRYGSLTAGNSSALTDGASAALIADEQRASDLGLKPKSRILDCLFIGVDPTEQLLIGPALAIPQLLKRQNLTFNDVDLIEIHEAFAAQVLSCTKSMASDEFCQRHFGTSAFGEIPDDKLNVNGGAIAIGHPFGATGVRLISTLSNELIRRDKKLGLIAICTAGGMAGAMLIERM